MSNLELIGKKLGMTREFYETGLSIPVTVLQMEKGRVITLVDKNKRGYSALQVGFGSIKNSKLTKSMKGFFAKKNTEPRKILREVRIDNVQEFKEGNEFGIEIFDNVKFVDVSDTKCKGKIIYGGYHGITLTKCFSEKDPRSKEIIKYLKKIY